MAVYQVFQYCHAYDSRGSPLDWLQQYFAWKVAIKPCKQHGVQDPPAYYGEQCGGADESIEIAKLAGFNATATFKHTMPRFNRPSARIPCQTLKGLSVRLCRHRSQ